MPPTISQSERGYSVRHGAYVRCFNQSERGYGVRHGVNVRCFNQPEHSYGVRHGVYATGCTSRCLTNQSIAMAYVTACTSRRVRHGVYVTVCTYAVQPIIISHTN